MFQAQFFTCSSHVSSGKDVRADLSAAHHPYDAILFFCWLTECHCEVSDRCHWCGNPHPLSHSDDEHFQKKNGLPRRASPSSQWHTKSGKFCFYRVSNLASLYEGGKGCGVNEQCSPLSNQRRGSSRHPDRQDGHFQSSRKVNRQISTNQWQLT